MKIVINKIYGGFGLSEEAVLLYCNKKGLKKNDNYFYDCAIARNDPCLVEVVEELGDLANGPFSELRVVEVPDDVKWIIEEYDGREWVAEQHRKWGLG